MKKRAKLNLVDLAMISIVSTMRGEGAVPIGPLYLAVMDRLSLHEFQALIRLMVSAGLAEHRPTHCIELTPAGLALAAQIDDKLAKLPPSQELQ